MTRKIDWPYHLASFFILAGAILTLISWLKLCSTYCSDAHNYRLFGLPFEISGAIFFLSIGVLHLIRKTKPVLLLISSGLGAELYFIFLQKSAIGSWCPVCLSIAFCLACLGLCYLIIYKNQPNEGFMRFTLLLSLTLIFGLASSFFGVGKIDQLEAAENSLKEGIKFGNRSSPIEIYIFTDWACPACRGVEPALEAMAPKISLEAQVTFVDAVVHPETLNFAPYNISFMVYNKPQYFQIRDALGQLSMKNKKPSDQDITAAVAPLGVAYHELPYEDVALTMKYFDELVDKLKVTGTPTIAIINPINKKGKKLSGKEITEANVLKAIHALR
jgi:thiol-disulfide isomerase/thioredoxin